MRLDSALNENRRLPASSTGAERVGGEAGEGVPEAVYSTISMGLCAGSSREASCRAEPAWLPATVRIQPKLELGLSNHNCTSAAVLVELKRFVAG